MRKLQRRLAHVERRRRGKRRPTREAPTAAEWITERLTIIAQRLAVGGPAVPGWHVEVDPAVVSGALKNFAHGERMGLSSPQMEQLRAVLYAERAYQEKEEP